MALNLGPAVGAKSQIGFAEEGKFGKASQSPTNFIEMLSEGIISELGNLVSQSLRPDRAVHKRKRSTESAGGDVPCEISPSGFETWFKHALGSVTTTRLDNAFVIECTDPTETGAILTITHVAGAATLFEVAFTENSGDDLSVDLTSGGGDTIAELMVLINANPYLACWSPYQLTQGAYQQTLDATDDYCLDADNTNRLEETADIDIMLTGTPGNRMWVVGTSWGVYRHVIDAASSLPEGFTTEVGRDVAAFSYAGSKVNNMELTCAPTEYLTGTFGIMAQGGTTADKPVADSGNTNNEKDAVKIRYTGSEATATLSIDHTNKNLTLATDGTTDDIVLNLSMPSVDPTTNIVSNVDKVGGLVSYLDGQSFLDCDIMDYTDPQTASEYLKDAAADTIHELTYVNFPFDSTDIVSLPVSWGDYIGTDEGDPDTFYVKAATGGAPGTATLTFQKNEDGYGNTVTTSATAASKIRTGANVDSGFTIFFPDTSDLVQDDVWEIKTIRTQSTTSYSAVEAFTGVEGALTIAGSAQDIQGFSATVNNNLYGDKFHMGVKTRAKLPEQKRLVEGSVTVEFDNLDLCRKFINGTQSNFVFTFTSPDYVTSTVLGDSKTQYAMAVRLPAVEFDGETPTASDESLIQTDMPFVALFDDVNDIPEMRITLTTDSAYA